jgi:DNA polymerase-3 subunit delta
VLVITLLIGENSFEIERAVGETARGFDGNVERIDGEKLQLADLPNIFMGVSLFAESRLLIVRNLSENRPIWVVFGDWLSKISDDIHLVLIESKPDKRTATFKALKSSAIVKEFQPWGERDVAKAEQWVSVEARKMGFEIDKKCVQTLIQRAGLDQWRLYHALEKLSFVDKVSVDIINDIIEADPVENVFNLFETAVNGDVDKLKKMLQTLEQTNDVYQMSALLFSQGFQLAAVVSAGPDDNVAKDFGVHPFVVAKLTQIAKKVGKDKIARIINALAEADEALKSTATDPWLLIERALIKIANI